MKQTNKDESEPEARPSDEKDGLLKEAQSTKKGRKERKSRRQKQRKEELKSKATGIGLKISVDSAPTNKKIVFDDSNLPSDGDDKDNDVNGGEAEENNSGDGDGDDDDDAVEEIKGTAARDEVLDQMKTEAQQSLKPKKKRNRKERREKPIEDSNGDEEMDEDFFAQLDSAREVEMEERKALEMSAKREALRGKHTAFVFSKNKNDDEGASVPLAINKNIQVVVLSNSSNSVAASFEPTTSLSEKALLYSRNRLKDGTDLLEGSKELQRKRKRSGAEIQPWKRSTKRISMGRSRLTKGRPSAFFKRKKR